MWRAATWNTWNTPSRLVANMRRHSSSVRSMKARRPPPPMPALAKQPSTRPNVSTWPSSPPSRRRDRRRRRSRVDLAGPGRHGCRRALVLARHCGPRSRRCSPGRSSACAMPRPMPPLPPVMTAVRPERSKMLIGLFPFRLARVKSCAQWRADVLMQPWTRASIKSNMGRDIRSDRPRNGIARKHKSRGNNAVQARYARFRWPGRHSQARSSGGHERGLDGHAGRSCRGARCDRREAGRRCAAWC